MATLATLILLSYAKLLEIYFKSLTVGILDYPDGTNERLWLPNATVKSLFKAQSSIHCSCSHSPGWSDLHCSSLLMAVSSPSSKVENFQVVKESKDTDFH